jgi:hypothetical protein
MNKKIIAIAILTIIAVTTPVFASTNTTNPLLPTQALGQSGGSITPWIKMKAEWIIGTWDDDAVKPYLQVKPPMGYGATKTLQYVMVATDDDGIGDLTPTLSTDTIAWADVYHPDGSFKYEVPYSYIVSCYDHASELESWIAKLNESYQRNLTWFDPRSNFTDVVKELRQCSAKLFVGQADMDYCQMCGQFTWTQVCSSCQNGWVASDFGDGYKVDAYVYDKGGARSINLTNYFEYICQAGLETDFTKLDFESVRQQTHKWIEGDRDWSNPKGPACKLLGGCVAPTVRNIGNTPMNISIVQDDMQFSYSGPSTNKTWNVQWDARLGEFNEHATSVYAPYQTVTLDGCIDLCQLNKISFSIYVNKMLVTGTHVGNVTLTAVPQDGHVCDEAE